MGLLAGEVKGVPVSVSLELSRWLLSSEMRLELPPLELRFSSAMLCNDTHVEEGCQKRVFFVSPSPSWKPVSPSSSSEPAQEEGTGGAASS